MRKFNIFTTLALIAVLAIGMTACQNDSSDSADSGDDATTTTLTDDGAAEPALVEGVSEVPQIPSTSVEWAAKIYDFGDITKGEKQKTVFTFKNTGDNPLVIASATAGCGCTVPKKPEEPIAPGDEGEIEVEYNGSGTGKISKNVTVLLNTDAGKEILNITANVLGGETPTTPPQ
ncbi:MAG: DUF1573 domain-containing protein [Bacteroidetes bacterium]|nr:DUF1573 domain-containing protein [Bacteroidota bacterium]